MNELPWGNSQYLNKEEFYNRTTEISNIKNLLNSTKESNAPDILLTGIRGVGKTVFLKRIKEELEDQYMIVYVDFSQADCFQKNNMSLTGLLEHYYKEIMNECKKNSITTTGNKIRKFFKTNKFDIKDITEVNGFPVPITTSNADINKLKDFIFNLPQEIYEENKDKLNGIIIIMDEFQIIKELGNYLDSFLWVFRSYIQNQRNVAYILSGSMSMQDQLIQDIAGRGGAFGGRMLTINLSPFSESTVRKYLNEKASELEFTEDGFKRFYKCTQGIPYYINIFGRLLPDQTVLDNDKVVNEFDNSLSYIAIHLINLWNRLTIKEKNIIITLIDNPLKRIEIAKKLDVTSGSLSNSLNKLQDINLIRFTNGYYEIAEPLLKRWLETEYQKKGNYPYRYI